MEVCHQQPTPPAILDEYFGMSHKKVAVESERKKGKPGITNWSVLSDEQMSNG